MGRAPCCEKMGLKKGPWTPEEDEILINFINQHGHSNWRALPKLAGLLRCGKSCRLRWTNYLRPDIKRGNFTQDEEETIINLHQLLGNRWSAIAAKLPGRTDNEIKNVWHTHLKKRLPKQSDDALENGSTTTTTNGSNVAGTTVGPTKKRARKSKPTKKGAVSEEPQKKHVKCVGDFEADVNKNCSNDNNNNKTTSNNNNNNNNNNNSDDDVRPTTSIIGDPVSPQPCTSEVSTITSTSTSENDKCSKENAREIKKEGYIGDFPEINDDFWMEVLSVEDTAISTEELPSISQCYQGTSPVYLPEEDSKVHSDDMDVFWYNLLTKSDDLPEMISEML